MEYVLDGGGWKRASVGSTEPAQDLGLPSLIEDRPLLASFNLTNAQRQMGSLVEKAKELMVNSVNTLAQRGQTHRDAS